MNYYGDEDNDEVDDDGDVDNSRWYITLGRYNTNDELLFMTSGIILLWAMKAINYLYR